MFISCIQQCVIDSVHRHINVRSAVPFLANPTPSGFEALDIYGPHNDLVCLQVS